MVLTCHVDQDVTAVIREQTLGAWCAGGQATCQHADEILHGNLLIEEWSNIDIKLTLHEA